MRLLLLALALTACGKKDDSPPPPAPAPTPSPSPSPSPSPAPTPSAPSPSTPPPPTRVGLPDDKLEKTLNELARLPEPGLMITGTGSNARGSGVGSLAAHNADGTLTKESVDHVIKRSAGKVRMCYQRVLNDHPNLTGKVVIHFKIKPDGAVTSARVQSTTLNNRKVEDCIVAVIKDLKFPTSETDSTVTYPFLFSQGG